MILCDVGVWVEGGRRLGSRPFHPLSLVWSAASGSAFFVLDKSAEALGLPGGCWFSGRLRCQGVGEERRVYRLLGLGDRAVRTAEVVGAASAETVQVPCSTRQPAALPLTGFRIVYAAGGLAGGVFLEVVSLLVLGGMVYVIFILRGSPALPVAFQRGRHSDLPSLLMCVCKRSEKKSNFLPSENKLSG